MRGRVGPAIVLALLAASAATAAAALSQKVVVTRAGTVAGCSVMTVAGAISTALDDFDAGRFEQLDRFFAPAAQRRSGHDFVWFSYHRPDADTTVRKRAALLPALKTLYAAGERFRLKELSTGRSAWTGSVALEYELAAMSADPAGGPAMRVEGKAELDCAARNAWVWSMGVTDGSTVRRLCPAPAQPVADDVALACVRGPAR